MKRLLPYHNANQTARDGFLEQVYGDGKVPRSDWDFVHSMKKDSFVTPVVRNRILDNARVLFTCRPVSA
jgi:hypothetical protein